MSRARSLQYFQEQISRLQPDNYIVLSGIVAYLLQSITSTPTKVPQFVTQALGELHYGSVMARFGQFFISDIHMSDALVIPTVTQKDNASVYQQANMPMKKRRQVSFEYF